MSYHCARALRLVGIVGLITGPLAALAACSPGPPPPPAGEAPREPTPIAACAPGDIEGEGGVCRRSGLRGCAAIFVDPDGICRPSTERCPSGTIPKFDEGCIPVGVRDCSPEFIDADGFCRPSIDKCELGSIPTFTGGCARVGLPACPAERVGPDGLCHVSGLMCVEGAWPFPSTGCSSIDACGNGPWGEIPDAPGTVYVDASAADGGDGSRTAPFTTIAAGMAAVGDGGVVAVAEGTYAEPLLIDRDVHVWGRCASRVRVEGTQPGAEEFDVVTRITGSGAHLTGVELGGSGIGLSIDAEDVQVDRTVVRQATIRGAELRAGATATFSEVVIADTQTDETGARGTGLRVTDGARLIAKRLAVLRNRTVGIAVSAASSLDLEDGFVTETRPSGTGIDVFPGLAVTDSVAVVRTSAFTDNVGANVGVSGLSDVSINDSVIEAAAANGDAFGFGVEIVERPGAAVRIERSAIVGNRSTAIAAFIEASMEVRTSLVARTLANASGNGEGAYVGSGANMVVEDSAFIDNEGSGLTANGGALLLARVITRGVPEGAPSLVAERPAIAVRAGGAAELIDVFAERSVRTGLYCRDAGSRLKVEASLVERTTPTVLGERGDGVIGIACEVVLQDSAFLGNHTTAVSVGLAGSTTVARSLLAGTRPTPATGLAGQGLSVSGPDAHIVDSTLLGNRASALFVETGSVVASGVLFEGTESEYATGEFGVGAYLTSGSNAQLQGCAVRRNRLAGLLVYNARASIYESLVDETQSGAFTDSFGNKYSDIGDGLVALFNSRADAFDLRVERCPRAGLLFDQALGGLDGNDLVGCGFGVVLQGAFQPKVGERNTYTSNTEQDLVIQGDLPVANAPLATPEPL